MYCLIDYSPDSILEEMPPPLPKIDQEQEMADQVNDHDVNQRYNEENRREDAEHENVHDNQYGRNIQRKRPRASPLNLFWKKTSSSNSSF